MSTTRAQFPRPLVGVNKCIVCCWHYRSVCVSIAFVSAPRSTFIHVRLSTVVLANEIGGCQNQYIFFIFYKFVGINKCIVYCLITVLFVSSAARSTFIHVRMSTVVLTNEIVGCQNQYKIVTLYQLSNQFNNEVVLRMEKGVRAKLLYKSQ